MKLKWLACFLFLLVSCRAVAITAFVRHNLFYAPKGATLVPYVEACWEIDPASLHFNKDSAWQTKVRVDVRFDNDTGSFSEDHFILQTSAATTKQIAMSQAILDLHRYPLTTGRMKFSVTFTELGQAGSGYTYSDTFTVNAAPGAGMSGLQLIDTAYRSTMETPFLRNGMQHIPLSIPFYNDKRAALNYYLELYGFDKIKDQGPFILNVNISKKMYDVPVERLIKNDTVAAEQVVPVYGSFPIMRLGSGNYYLNATVYNLIGKEIAKTSVFFQRSNKNPLTDSMTVASNEFDTSAQKDVYMFNIHKTFVAKYDHAQLKAILKMLLPISDVPERQNIQGFITNPDEMYTRYFIYNFWLTRNQNKPDKEWEKYADKVREVNKLFSSGAIPGYESDRGYIYLKYGKPNERIIVTAESEALPYEVWQYFKVSTQGRDGVFLFYKPENSANDYRLLHSTATTEAKDMNWRRTLYPNGLNDNSDSKAEQYLRNR
jgi:GWxTD domain-containing protein